MDNENITYRHETNAPDTAQKDVRDFIFFGVDWAFTPIMDSKECRSTQWYKMRSWVENRPRSPFYT